MIRTGTDMYFNNVGYIGVNTTAPQAALDINGFTKLGSDAPKIKFKKLVC